RIIIPAINADASVERVGLTKEKAMDVPKDIENAGWFSPGPRPGERGTAVIAGHYGWMGNRKVVFDDLGKLRKGDLIHIEDNNGKRTSFSVREIKKYDPGENTSDIFFTQGNRDASGSHLNLITCDGEWNTAQQNYSKRLVIFADLTESAGN
ncbi:MAG: class F sortase, partial [bacterium]|nr:class F sortase [bacterium]